jgi:hypothetical protein
MSEMASPDEQFDRIANDLLSKGDTKRAKMFGMPCISVNGKMFAGLHKGGMNFKLGASDREEALRIEGATLFDPGMGRPMKEWVSVPAAQSDRWCDLADQAYTYVADLTSK